MIDLQPLAPAFVVKSDPASLWELQKVGRDKRTQDRDIRQAKQYWREFKVSES